MDVNRYAENNQADHTGMDVPDLPNFGARLAWWRRARGYRKQGDLSAKIGIAQGSLSGLESGDSKEPSAKVLLRLCDELQLRPKYLLLNEGPPQAQYFQELTGSEAQLVMLFRQLPTDAAREALLIDVNDRLERSRADPRRVLEEARGVLNAPPRRKRTRTG